MLCLRQSIACHVTGALAAVRALPAHADMSVLCQCFVFVSLDISLCCLSPWWMYSWFIHRSFSGDTRVYGYIITLVIIYIISIGITELIFKSRGCFCPYPKDTIQPIASYLIIVLICSPIFLLCDLVNPYVRIVIIVTLVWVFPYASLKVRPQ